MQAVGGLGAGLVAAGEVVLPVVDELAHVLPVVGLVGLDEAVEQTQLSDLLAIGEAACLGAAVPAQRRGRR